MMKRRETEDGARKRGILLIRRTGGREGGKAERARIGKFLFSTGIKSSDGETKIKIKITIYRKRVRTRVE